MSNNGIWASTLITTFIKYALHAHDAAREEVYESMH